MKAHLTQKELQHSLNCHSIFNGIFLSSLLILCLLSCEKIPPQKEGVPPNPTGGTVRIKPLVAKTGIKRAVAKGVESILIHLDGDKINRVNQRRNPHLLGTYPEMFGQNNDFKPLLVLKAKGPGKIIIHGPIVGNVEIPINSDYQEIEIYPEYNLNQLFTGFYGEEEEISIFFEENNKKIFVDRLKTAWSGPTDLFLSDNSLSDLTTIVQNETLLEKQKSQSAKEWLTTTPSFIYNLGIKYKKAQSAPNGWQRIKTMEEVVRTKTANCLDISVLLCKLATSEGYETTLLITEEHALIGIKQEESQNQPTYLEGTILINGNFKPKDISQIALATAKHFVNTEFTKNSKKMFALNLSEWENIYRKNPKK